MTDALIQAARDGDEQALTQLIQEHYEAIYRFCCWKVRDRETARDITQETFLRFIAALSRYTSQGKLRAYLYTIARNLCADWHKRKPAYLLAEPDHAFDPLPLSHQGLDDDQLWLRDLVERLPDHQREAVILRYGHDLKLSEIAQITQTTRFTVQYRLKGALTALRSQMKGGPNE
ncbi:RNA polymerase sigma factor [Paenibacillus senegalensis]|uniref:RNA polymerase sigma factor n=1 Tax=Paenibacillus senegalensis TaxID=1465766 RepID=UPI000289ABE2|nr:RNA polymerase sigma factor [Paenibacillus senegalensis]